MLSARIERERQFHNSRYGHSSGLGRAKYYTICGSVRDRYRNIIRSLCGDHRVLEYGCGAGSVLSEVCQAGAAMTGIDISERAIDVARQKAISCGQNIDLRVMNAEELSFKDNSFDLVVGTGILHHLNLDAAMGELSRVLDSARGLAVFIEPLGHNPLVNLFRLLTPRIRTPDEHPLTRHDIQVMEKYFREVEVIPYYLFALAAIPFRRTRFFPSLLTVLEKLDRMLFRLFPQCKWHAWQVLLVLRTPMKGQVVPESPGISS